MFEYKVIESSGPVDSKSLNAFGKDGWQLVSAYSFIEPPMIAGGGPRLSIIYTFIKVITDIESLSK